MCVCVPVCAHVHIHVEARGQPHWCSQNSQLLCFVCLFQYSLSLGSGGSLSWLKIRPESLRGAPICGFPILGLQACVTHAWLFTWALGIELMLV